MNILFEINFNENDLLTVITIIKKFKLAHQGLHRPYGTI